MTASAGPVWVVCWRYPFLLETIVAEEFEEMVRTGMDGFLIPLHAADGAATEVDIPQERVLRPVQWPTEVWARLVVLTRSLLMRPRCAAQLLARLSRIVGDDAKGALVTTVRILAGAQGRRPAHVHAHFAGHLAHVASLLAAFYGCSWSASAHARDIYTKPDRLRIDFEGVSFVRAISTHGKNWLLKFVPSLGSDRVHLVYCGINLRKARRPAESHAAEDRAFQLVSVGRLIPKKGHDLLLEAMAELVVEAFDLTCTIVGDGPEGPALRGLAARRGLADRVRFLQGLPREDLLDVLQAADLFVMACRVDAEGDRDGIPLAMMEAMALGKPVVAGTAGGTLELVTKGGLAVSTDTQEETRDAIRRIASMPRSERLALGRQARERIEEAFCLERNAAVLRALLEEAASR